MKGLNLKILEKGSQKFDGVICQDNRQNSKALVPRESSKDRIKIINAHKSTFKSRHIKNTQSSMLL